MAFCTNCGKELAADANFCSNCGAAAGTAGNTKRKSVYDGELHKCPGCGEVMNSFATTCPSCGLELRGVQSARSVTIFADRLATAESQEQKITLIRNFPIPNTKEDILEFMILASSNIDSNMEDKVSEAWLAKMEQSYQKGKLLFADDTYFVSIQNAYEQAHAKIKNTAQRKRNKSVLSVALRTMGLWGGLLIFVIAFAIDANAIHALRYSDTSVYHVGAGAVMIFGAYVVGKRFNSLACAGVGIACGVLSMLMGSLLESVFCGNGSMMMVVGGAVVIMSIVNLVRNPRSK